jgi:Na+/proline symporter
VVTDWSLAVCVFWVVLFAIAWSALAGLKTVIWTDFLLFVIFTGGAVFSIAWTSGQLDMSFGEAFARLDGAAKLTLFDFSVDPGKSYTLWAGLIGGSLLSLAMAGSQGTMQRIRACRSAADARKAYLLSALFYLTPLCMLGVGLVLTLFYQEHPLSPEVAASLVTQPDRIFPHFIASEIPAGFSAIFIGAIFAAGISTLDTALTEMADITITNIYEPRSPGRSEAHYLLASRFSLVFWGALYAAVALFFSRFSAEGLLDLTFKLPNYLNGALLGTILLARLGIGDVRTYATGFVAAMATVALMSYAGIGFFWWCPGSALVMIGVVAGLQRKPIEPSGFVL